MILSKADDSYQKMARIVSERMVKSFLDLFVLAILNGGSRHGYDIMRQLKAWTGARIGPGTLYPLLYELEDWELVSAEWMSPTRRSRRVYKITEKGERFRQEGFRGLDHLLPRDIGKVRLLRQQAPQGTGGENARKILETVTVR